MGKINWVQVLLGGLVAGLVINIFEYVTNGVVLAANWDAAMKEQLRILNSTLLNIKVLTYDHLLAMGNNILELYAPEEDIPF